MISTEAEKNEEGKSPLCAGDKWRAHNHETCFIGIVEHSLLGQIVLSKHSQTAYPTAPTPFCLNRWKSNKMENIFSYNLFNFSIMCTCIWLYVVDQDKESGEGSVVSVVCWLS